MQNTNENNERNYDEGIDNEKIILFSIAGVAAVAGFLIILSCYNKPNSSHKSHNKKNTSIRKSQPHIEDEINSIVTEDFGDEIVNTGNESRNNDEGQIKKAKAPSCNEIRGRVRARRNKLVPSTVSSIG